MNIQNASIGLYDSGATPDPMKDQLKRLNDYLNDMVKWLTQRAEAKSNDVVAKTKKEADSSSQEPSKKAATDASKELFKCLRGAAATWNLAISWLPKLDSLKPELRSLGKNRIESVVLAGMNYTAYEAFSKESAESIKHYYPIIFNGFSAFCGNPPYKSGEAKDVINGKVAAAKNGSTFSPIALKHLEWILQALLLCGMEEDYLAWCKELQKTTRDDLNEKKELTSLQQRALIKFVQTTDGSVNADKSSATPDGIDLQQTVIDDLKSENAKLNALNKKQQAEILELKALIEKQRQISDEYEKRRIYQVDINERLVEHARAREQALERECREALALVDEIKFELQQRITENDERLRVICAEKQVAIDSLRAVEADLQQLKHDLEQEKKRGESIEVDLKERFVTDLIRKINDSLNNFFGYLADWRGRESSVDDKALNDCCENDIKLICKALSELGAAPIGSFDGKIIYDPSCCECDDTIHDGEEVIVQMIGWRYENHIIRKAYVTRLEVK